MTRTTESDFDDFGPMTSGRGPRSKPLVNSKEVKAIGDRTELEVHLTHLLALHPDLRQRFGLPELDQLDEDEKRSLLRNLNAALGIVD